MNTFFLAALSVLIFDLSSLPLLANTPLPAPKIRCRDFNVHTKELYFRSFLSTHKTDLADLGIELSYENKVLTINHKVSLPLLPKRETYEDCLLFTSMDHEKAQIVYKAYKTHIHPLLLNDKALQNSFIGFLQQHFYMVGSPFYDLGDTLGLFGIFDNLRKDGQGSKALVSFQNEVKVEMEKANAAITPTTPTGRRNHNTVLMFHGPYGSGHISVSKAMEEAIDPRTEVKVLDECSDSEDILYKAVGYYSCRIWTDFTLRDANEKRAEVLYTLTKYLQDFLIQDRVGHLRRKALKIAPNLIISNIHHVIEMTELAHAMVLPLVISVSDFSLPENQWKHINHMKYPVVSYWIPTKNRNFFRRMLTRLAGTPHIQKHQRLGLLQELLFSQEADFEETMQDMEIFKISGFPVAKPFRKRVSAKEVAKIREDLKLTSDPERRVIGLTYGGTVPVPQYKKLLEALINNQKQLNHKIQIAMLTGNNTKAYQALPTILENLGLRFSNEESMQALPKSDDLITVHIFRQLSYPHAISTFYKATDLILSKAGGATSAELAASRTRYLRAFGVQNWEVENVKYLESAGLTTTAKNFVSLANPLQENLKLYEKDIDIDDLISEINRSLTSPPPIQEDIVVPFNPVLMNQNISNTIFEFNRFNNNTASIIKRPIVANSRR